MLESLLNEFEHFSDCDESDISVITQPMPSSSWSTLEHDGSVTSFANSKANTGETMSLEESDDESES